MCNGDIGELHDNVKTTLTCILFDYTSFLFLLLTYSEIMKL